MNQRLNVRIAGSEEAHFSPLHLVKRVELIFDKYERQYVSMRRDNKFYTFVGGIFPAGR